MDAVVLVRADEKVDSVRVRALRLVALLLIPPPPLLTVLRRAPSPPVRALIPPLL